jgi:2-C-methyl-D-erythritol 4-phosphate cytidylyltransferase
LVISDGALPKAHHPLAAEGQGGGYAVSVTAVPVSDTCKEVIDGLVRRTVPRDSLVTVTGPWVFTRESLIDALTRIEGREGGITGMVDFSQTARLKVRVVVGP